MPDLLTTTEVAEALRVSVEHVRRMIRDGRLPATQVGDRVYRVERAALLRWLEGRQVSPGAA